MLIQTIERDDIERSMGALIKLNLIKGYETLKSFVNYVPGVYCDGADKNLSQIEELSRD